MAAIPVLADLLEELVAYYGSRAILQWLVDQGILSQEAADLLGLTVGVSTANQTDQDVQQIQRTLDNPTSGLPGIITLVKRNAIDVTSIVSKLDSLTTQVSNLPSAPGVGDIAAQVWGYPNSGEDIPAYSHLLYIERFAATIGRAAAFPFQDDAFLIATTRWKYPPD